MLTDADIVREILLMRARRRLGPITYAELMPLFGLSNKKRSDGAEIGKLLDAGCMPLWHSDRIALGSMVIGSGGRPSPQWFERFKELDFRPGETKKAFHQRMLADVAAYATSGASEG